MPARREQLPEFPPLELGGEMNAGVLPSCAFPDLPARARTEGPGQARCADDDRLLARVSGKGDEMIRGFSLDGQRLIVAMGEKCRTRLPQPQQEVRHVQFDAPVLPLRKELSRQLRRVFVREPLHQPA